MYLAVHKTVLAALILHRMLCTPEKQQIIIKGKTMYYLIQMDTTICLQDSLTLPENEELDIWHVIDGLQPFSQYSITVACSGDYGLWSDWSKEFLCMTLEASK